MAGHNKKKNTLPNPLENPFAGHQWSGMDDATKQKIKDLINRKKTDPPIFPEGNGTVSDTPYGYGSVGGSINSFFDSLLNKGGNSMDALMALLNQLGHWDSELTPQFLQYVLQHGLNADQRAYDRELTLEQRQYDKQLLEEQRLYNNPLNELARLMASGIGRDAAIQLMSGSAGGQGLGQGSPVSGSPAAAPAASGTPGTLALQRGLGITNTIVNAIGQLTDAGLSLAQGVEAVRGMHMQNSMTQQQLASYNNANQLVQQIQSSGIDLSQYSNADDLIKYLNEQASNNNETALGIVNSPSFAGTFGTLAGRDFFNQFWSSVRSSRDAGTIADNYLHQQDLQNALSSVQIDKIGAEMSLIGAQENEVEQRIIESCSRVADINADIKVKNLQGEWISVQTKNYQRLVDAQVNQMDASAWLANNQGDLAVAQTEGQNLNNQINKDIFEINHAGFPMMKDAHIIECERELRKLRLQNDSEGQKKQLQQWALEQDNAVKLAYLEQIYNQSAGDFIIQHPTLYALATGFHLCGANELVQTGVGASSALGSAIKFGLKLIK